MIKYCEVPAAYILALQNRMHNILNIMFKSTRNLKGAERSDVCSSALPKFSNEQFRIKSEFVV